MPSISQQDYIYIEVESVNEFTLEERKQIAKAIDNGVGLDVVLRERFNDGVTIVDSRVLCARGSDGGSYYVAFWDYEDDQMTFAEFDLEENNEEA